MIVSIIIPCYNVEDYIVECIQSCINQTYSQIEIICIDNNSTDQTWNKLETFKNEYPSLIIAKEPKPGATAARNKGFSLAKGEWLQFLDADDLLKPKKIEQQLHLINNKSQAAFIAGACLKRDLNGHDILCSPKRGNPFKSLFTTQLGNTCANLWNRQYLRAINGWDEALKSSQEADLMYRVLQVNENVIFDDEPLTIVRERPFGQISQTNHSEKWQRYFEKRVEMVHWLSQNKPEHYATEKYFYEDALFGFLKIIANNNSHDFQTANRLYKQYFKGNYHPSTFQNHSTKAYLLLFRIFGFKGAERIRSKFWEKR